ncbi:MAG: hypothetical protein R3A80_09000, partial [Bdellovibrionota bacterium]
MLRFYQEKALRIHAYRDVYKTHGTGAIINKQNFHVKYSNIYDRIPDNIPETIKAQIEVLNTSGSSSGKTSSIPIIPQDITHMLNYYKNLSIISEEVIPHKYGYINMFPIT